MLIFRATNQLLKDLMSWAGCQNNPIYLNFHFQKSLEIFEKNSAEKIWSKKDKGIKMPCPVPDRVKEDIHFWLEVKVLSSLALNAKSENLILSVL